MHIGSHISIRHGYLGAAKTAMHIGATAFQYFPKNPRSLTIKAFDRREAEACAVFCLEHGLLSIAHAPYPVNLASDDSTFRSAMILSLLNDLDIAEACGSVGVVVHFGKFQGKDRLQGYKNIINSLNETLSRWEGKAKLLVENQAGDGSSMGTTLEELTQIRNLASHPERIGFCFDTCHAFACGLWTGDNWAALELKGRGLGYFDVLEAIHLNDSSFPSGSLRDRHANIGKGHIGLDPMRQLLQSPVIPNIPIVLETAPGADHTHKDEIAMVRGLAELDTNR